MKRFTFYTVIIASLISCGYKKDAKIINTSDPNTIGKDTQIEVNNQYILESGLNIEVETYSNEIPDVVKVSIVNKKDTLELTNMVLAIQLGEFQKIKGGYSGGVSKFRYLNNPLVLIGDTIVTHLIDLNEINFIKYNNKNEVNFDEIKSRLRNEPNYNVYVTMSNMDLLNDPLRSSSLVYSNRLQFNK